MTRKKRVFFRGYYDRHNFGDDLILIAWLEFLSGVLKFRDEEFEPYLTRKSGSLTKLNFKGPLSLNYLEPPEITDYINEAFKRFRIPLRLPGLRYLIQGIKKRKSFLYFCAFILLTLILAIEVIIYRISGKSFFIKRYLDFLKNLDVIHYVGGGYFNDIWIETLIDDFFLVLLAKAVNPHLKVIGTGLGLGPLKKGISRVIFKVFTKNFDYLFVRENKSLKLLEDLGIDTYKKTLGDDALLLFPWFEKIKNTQRGCTKGKIAFNLKNFFDHNYYPVKENIESYMRLMEFQGNKVEYFCFGAGPGPDDRKMTQIFDEERRKNLTIHDPYEEGWTDFFENLVQVGAGLGFAYHFCVLLTLLGIPVVSVYSGEYYRQKMEGGIKWLNKDAVILSIGELASRNLAKVVNTAKALRQENINGKPASMYKEMTSEYTRAYKNIFSDI